MIPPRDSPSATAQCGTAEDSWLPPNSGWLKANFDASFKPDTGATFGLVVRDEKGSLIVVATLHAGTQFDAEVAEALCFRWAVKLCHSLLCTQVQFETDCISLLNA